MAHLIRTLGKGQWQREPFNKAFEANLNPAAEEMTDALTHGVMFAVFTGRAEAMEKRTERWKRTWSGVWIRVARRWKPGPMRYARKSRRGTHWSNSWTTGRPATSAWSCWNTLASRRSRSRSARQLWPKPDPSFGTIELP